MKAIDLIASSLRMLNAISSGEPVSAAEGQDALMVLNQMIDSWNTERLNIFTVQRQVYALTPGKQVYTFGPGGDFNGPRPPRIENAGIVSLQNPVESLELPLDKLTAAGWAAIPVKNISSTLPQRFWDDEAMPYRNISFWCVPSIAVNVAMYVWQALAQFPNLYQDLQFPPGYLRALRYNLAVDLSAEWGVAQVPPAVAAIAGQSKAAIKSLNVQPIESRCDNALVQPDKQIFNWLTGEAQTPRG